MTGVGYEHKMASVMGLFFQGQVQLMLKDVIHIFFRKAFCLVSIHLYVTYFHDMLPNDIVSNFGCHRPLK